MPRARIRPATAKDLDLLVGHRRGMWTSLGARDAGLLDAADRQYRRWARPRLRSGRLVAWIVEAGGEPVASGSLWLQEVQPRPYWTRPHRPYLLSMFTEPAHRGKGHAERIVRASIRWCREHGYPATTLHASKMGRGLYARLGYERTWEMQLDGLARRRPAARRRRA